MSFVYREMKREDVAQVFLIDRSCFSHNWSLDSYEKEIENHLATYIVALDNDTIVGFGGYWLIVDEAHITNIAVLKGYRKKGVGQGIFDQMAMTASACGVRKMTLEVSENNFSAISFYEKNDFSKEGMRFHYYGNDRHALIMWRHSYEE